MSIVIQNAKFSDGRLLIDPEHERFENCILDKCEIVVSRYTGRPIFYHVIFQNCTFLYGDKRDENGCHVSEPFDYRFMQECLIHWGG